MKKKASDGETQLEASCPYTTKSSTNVASNKFRRKMEDSSGGDAPTPGTPATPAEILKSVIKLSKT